MRPRTPPGVGADELEGTVDWRQHMHAPWEVRRLPLDSDASMLSSRFLRALRRGVLVPLPLARGLMLMRGLLRCEASGESSSCSRRAAAGLWAGVRAQGGGGGALMPLISLRRLGRLHAAAWGGTHAGICAGAGAGMCAAPQTWKPRAGGGTANVLVQRCCELGVR